MNNPETLPFGWEEGIVWHFIGQHPVLIKQEVHIP
jgi:hypothetical protein